MPFLSMGSNEPPPIRLLQRGENTFQLLTGFRYRDPSPDGKVYVVERHDETKPPDGDNGTDLASIPAPLWGLIASHGRQTLPALLHDDLCVKARHCDDGLAYRRNADRVFRVALREQGVSLFRRWEMWAAVSVFRYRDFSRKRFWAIVLFLLLHGVSFVVVPLMFGGPGFLAALLAPLATSWIWGADAPAVLIATYAVPVVAPAAVVAAVAGILLDPVTALKELAHGKVPIVRPTVFRPGLGGT